MVVDNVVSGCRGKAAVHSQKLALSLTERGVSGFNKLFTAKAFRIPSCSLVLGNCRFNCPALR